MENKTVAELIVLCRKRGIKGYTGKKKEDLIKLLQGRTIPRENNASTPARVRNVLWRLHFNALDGECYVCRALISFDNFEAGHVVARKNGGSAELYNLKPICTACNRSMGTTNMEDFKLTLGCSMRESKGNYCAMCNNSGMFTPPKRGVAMLYSRAEFCSCKLGRERARRALHHNPSKTVWTL